MDIHFRKRATVGLSAMTSETRAAIVAALVDVRRLLSKSQADFAAMDEDQLIDLYERLDEHVDRLGGLIPDATPPGRIEDFFTQVGDGMVAAQDELDRQSFAYNRDRPEGALPSAYRIPKVQAEIGFTMSRRREKRFGVFALGRTAGGEKRRSNTVSFEILSVPPAADALDQIPLGVRFVNRNTERAQVKLGLENAKAENSVSASTASAMLAEFDRVLIVAREGEWLLAHVILVDGDVPATTSFGLLTEGPPPRFSSHGAVPASQAEQGRWVQLRDFLNRISTAQADLLREDT